MHYPIDIDKYLIFNQTNEPALQQFYSAMLKQGFVIITTRLLDQAILDKTQQSIKQFFFLPDAIKRQSISKQAALGYIPSNSTRYNSNAQQRLPKKDLNQTLLLALERAPENALIKANLPFVGPNPWPQSLDGFKDNICTYQQLMNHIGQKLLALIAAMLSLPTHFFDEYFNDPMALCRFSHYPPIQDKNIDFGISPHTDHGFLTLLPIPKQPGLEMQTETGLWQQIPYSNNALLINVGDFLQRWTNDQLIAPLHRVTVPAQDRYSLTFFYNPHPTTIAKPLLTNNKLTKYEPISMKDYLIWYAMQNYTKKTQATSQHAD